MSFINILDMCLRVIVEKIGFEKFFLTEKIISKFYILFNGTQNIINKFYLKINIFANLLFEFLRIFVFVLTLVDKNYIIFVMVHIINENMIMNYITIY